MPKAGLGLFLRPHATIAEGTNLCPLCNKTGHSRGATTKFEGLHPYGQHKKVILCGGQNRKQPRAICEHA